MKRENISKAQALSDLLQNVESISGRIKVGHRISIHSPDLGTVVVTATESMIDNIESIFDEVSLDLREKLSELGVE